MGSGISGGGGVAEDPYNPAKALSAVTSYAYIRDVNLNVRNFPADLHLRLIDKASVTGYDLRDLVIEAVENSLVVASQQVTCPLCGESGDLKMAGTNCRCVHCGAGFIMPEGV